MERETEMCNGQVLGKKVGADWPLCVISSDRRDTRCI